MATCACCLTQMTSSFHDCIRQISATEGSKDSPANLLIHLKSYFNTKFDKKNKWRPLKLIDKCLQTDYLCIAESWFWTSSFSSLRGKRGAVGLPLVSFCTVVRTRKHEGRPEGARRKRKGNSWMMHVLGPKLLLPMGCVKLGEENCVHLPFVGEQTAN